LPVEDGELTSQLATRLVSVTVTGTPNNTREPARLGKKKPQPRTVGVLALVAEGEYEVSFGGMRIRAERCGFLITGADYAARLIPLNWTHVGKHMQRKKRWPGPLRDVRFPARPDTHSKYRIVQRQSCLAQPQAFACEAASDSETLWPSLAAELHQCAKLGQHSTDPVQPVKRNLPLERERPPRYPAPLSGVFRIPQCPWWCFPASTKQKRWNPC